LEKIIFVDGVDGSGKTQTIKELVKNFQKKPNTECRVVDQNFSKTYNSLLEIDKKYNTTSTVLTKFSYRYSRLNLALNELKESKGIGIFDRGLIHFISKSKIDKVNGELIDLFVKEFLENLSKKKILHVFLNPPFNIVIERLEKRNNPSDLDKDFTFLDKYYQIANDVFRNYPDLGDKIEIDTNIKSTREIVKIISSRSNLEF